MKQLWKYKVAGLFVTILSMMNVMEAFAWGNTTVSPLFQERISQLQEEYPYGKELGVNYTYDNSWQCVAYAKTICYGVFGTKWATWEEHNRSEDPNLDGLSVGDYLRFGRLDGNTHSIFVTGLDGDQIYFTDGNWDHPNKVRWNISITKNELLTNRNTYYQAYRHASNYKDIFPEKPAQVYKEDWVWDTDRGFWKYQFSDGRFATNEFVDLGRDKKYYFKDDSSLVWGCFCEIDGEWYSFAKDGHADLGWQPIEGEWYYFNDPSGKMEKNCWASYEGKKYYLSNSGARYRNTVQTIDGKVYLFDENGVAMEAVTDLQGDKVVQSNRNKNELQPIKGESVPCYNGGGGRGF